MRVFFEIIDNFAAGTLYWFATKYNRLMARLTKKTLSNERQRVYKARFEKTARRQG